MTAESKASDAAQSGACISPSTLPLILQYSYRESIIHPPGYSQERESKASVNPTWFFVWVISTVLLQVTFFPQHHIMQLIFADMRSGDLFCFTATWYSIVKVHHI